LNVILGHITGSGGINVAQPTVSESDSVDNNQFPLHFSTVSGAVAEVEKILASFRGDIDAIIEKWLPRKLDDKSFAFLCGKPRYTYDHQSATKGIIEPMYNILDRGGKRWRPALLLLIAEALGGKKADVIDFVVICELVHNGSLVVDDIEDGSQLRRGLPCLHRIYTLDVAINAGQAMYYFPLIVLREKRHKLPDSVLLTAYEYYSQENDQSACRTRSRYLVA